MLCSLNPARVLIVTMDDRNLNDQNTVFLGINGTSVAFMLEVGLALGRDESHPANQ